MQYFFVVRVHMQAVVFGLTERDERVSDRSLGLMNNGDKQKEAGKCPPRNFVRYNAYSGCPLQPGPYKAGCLTLMIG